jgi:diguanylate cyclase (GGDEF)-like protein
MNRPFSGATFRDAARAAWSGLRSLPARIGRGNIRQAVAGVFPYVGPRSLANRILLLQLFWTLFIYLLMIATLWFATNLIVKNGIRHQGQDWIAKLDEMGMPIYASNKPERLKQAISYLRNFPEIARVRYLDETGKKAIAEYKRADGPASEPAPLTDDAIQKLGRTDVEQKPLMYEDESADALMRISAPIWIKSISRDAMLDYSLDKRSDEKIKTIGFIEVVLDYSKTMSNLNRDIFRASMIIAVAMLASALIMRFMVRRALKPLSALEAPLTRLANGETDVTVNATGDKEIARIGMALNTTISALKARDEALRQLAVHDVLTGLVNRGYFIERLEQEVKRVARGGSGAALLFFDLDRFKNINDTYGHAAGDRLLVEVTRLLSQRIREYDVFARYGGDEFTLLAYNVDEKNAKEIAESFIELMRGFTFYETGDAVQVHCSIGVTLIDSGGITTQEYLNEADAAANQAKKSGRNCFRMFVRDMHRAGTSACRKCSTSSRPSCIISRWSA